MMLERFIWYTGSGIASAVSAWIGIAAFLTGLNKFGLYVKFPLWLLFLVLWVVATFAGFLGGSMATKTILLIAFSALIIGILFYLVSLVMGKNREGVKRK